MIVFSKHTMCYLVIICIDIEKMSKQKTCPCCQRMTSIPTREGVALPNQRCSHCGFRIPDESQRPLMKSSDYGD